jgi:hypothetical protein
MTLLMGCNSTSKIVGRADIDVAVAELGKIDVPHGNSLPTLLSELQETPFTLAVSGACHPKPARVSGEALESRTSEQQHHDQSQTYWGKLEPLAKRINKAGVHSTRGLRAKALVALWEVLPSSSGGRELCTDWDEPAQTLLHAAAEVAGLRSMMDYMECQLSALTNEGAGA